MADVTRDAAVLQPNLSLVLERITDGFFALDAEWRIAYMNSEARKLLLAGEEDVVGRYWLEAFPKARGRLFEREYGRAMRDQQPVQFIEFSKTSNAWFEVKAYPSADGLSVYFRDVSARVEAQREIEKNVRRQQALIDFGRAALAGATLDQIINDAVDLVRDIVETSVVEIFDYERQGHVFRARRVVGWGTRAQFDPVKPMIAHLLYAVRTGEPFVCPDVRIDPRARSLVALESCGILSCVCVLIGTPQQPIGVIAAYYPETRTFTVADVRFIEAIAQTVAETASALESHHRMAQVLDSIRDAFVAVDREMKVTYVNARMARFWRRTPVQMIGTNLSEYTKEFGDEGRALLHFREALGSDRPLTFEVQTHGRWYETRLYPFSDGVAAYVRDITRRKREQARVMEINAELERRVADRTEQLELANKELESFSYSVSHDLRAPLRAIDGFSQALVEDYGEQLDERARNYLDRVRKAAQRMADLIDALLKLSRVARASISFIPADITAIASSFLTELAEQHPDREVEVVVEQELSAFGEPHLIRALLENLLGNAWKFTRHTPHARIEVGRTPAGEFYVRDNGAGFDMAYGNKLFGAFQRLHSTEEYEGTGIGLATVARIVHRHGGSIRAEGAIGSGATFYFSLPKGSTEPHN